MVNNNWIPARREIIWINCPPQIGNEMANIHPFLVLSSQNFNDKTSLVLGLPMTTAEYNKNNPFALNIGKIIKQSKKLDGYILCYQIKSFDWRQRKASKHQMGKLGIVKFKAVCDILNQIINI